MLSRRATTGCAKRDTTGAVPWRWAWVINADRPPVAAGCGICDRAGFEPARCCLRSPGHVHSRPWGALCRPGRRRAGGDGRYPPKPPVPVRSCAVSSPGARRWYFLGLCGTPPAHSEGPLRPDSAVIAADSRWRCTRPSASPLRRRGCAGSTRTAGAHRRARGSRGPASRRR